MHVVVVSGTLPSIRHTPGPSHPQAHGQHRELSSARMSLGREQDMATPLDINRHRGTAAAANALPLECHLEGNEMAIPLDTNRHPHRGTAGQPVRNDSRIILHNLTVSCVREISGAANHEASGPATRRRRQCHTVTHATPMTPPLRGKSKN